VLWKIAQRGVKEGLCFCVKREEALGALYRLGLYYKEGYFYAIPRG
jgi:hypothetical protein